MKISDFLNEKYSDSALYINYRSTPSYIDGLKNSGRKCIYTFKKKKPASEVKVSNFAGAVIDESNYLHGNTSMEGTIVTLSQDYCGSNNIPLLGSEGAFGTRFVPESSAPRYIFIKQISYMDDLFKKSDEVNLIEQQFEGDTIEPVFYTPTIPLLLANGSVGIGVGFSAKILARPVKNVFTMIRNKIEKKKLSDKLFIPGWRGYRGEVRNVGPNKWEIRGVISISDKDPRKVCISEIPVSYGLKSYNDYLKKLKDEGKIDKYIDYSENDMFTFEVKLSPEYVGKSEDEIMNMLGLVDTITETLTCIDENNAIREFDSVQEIFDDYYKIKIKYLKKRIVSETKRIEEELNYTTEVYKFIMDIIKGNIKINNVKRAEVEKKMKELGYTYIEKLISMPAYNFTKEKADEAKKKLQEKKQELASMKNETPENMWLKDLDELEAKLKKMNYYC